jgi:hypothetical protein
MDFVIKKPNHVLEKQKAMQVSSCGVSGFLADWIASVPIGLGVVCSVSGVSMSDGDWLLGLEGTREDGKRGGMRWGQNVGAGHTRGGSVWHEWMTVGGCSGKGCAWSEDHGPLVAFAAKGALRREDLSSREQ